MFIARASTVAACCALVLSLAGFVTEASAEIIGSQISAPSDPSFVLSDAGLSGGGPSITVSGTVTGTVAAVDLDCYVKSTGERRQLIANQVKVEPDNSFSVQVEPQSFQPEPCVLRAVPHGDFDFQPPTTTPFAGLHVAASKFEPLMGTFSHVPAGFVARLTSTDALLELESPGYCGLSVSRLYEPEPFLPETNYLFHCDAALFERDNAETGAEIVVDGAYGYDPASADKIDRNLGEEVGSPVAQVSHKFDSATGVITVHETDPIDKCSPEAEVLPSAGTCTSLVATGVTLERTWVTGNSNRSAVASDAWRSTDGTAHSVSLLYDQKLHEAGHEGQFALPGSSSFAPTKAGQKIPVPAGPAAIYFEGQAATPEHEYPIGAIVYDTAPSSSPTFSEGTEDSPSSEPKFELPYTLALPASGAASTLRFGYAQAHALTEVRTIAGATLTAFGADSSGNNSGNNPSNNANTTPTSGEVAKTPASVVPALARLALAGAVSGARERITLTLSCAAAPCNATVSATTLETLRGSKVTAVAARAHTKTITVASKKVSIAAGTSARVVLTLNASARKLLEKFHALPARVVVALGTSTIAKRSVTIHAPPKTRRAS